MEIQCENDRNVRTEYLARPPQRVPLDVILALGRLRPMHSQQQALQLTGCRELGRELLHQPLKIRTNEPVGGDRPSGANRSDLFSGLRQSVDEAAHLGQLAPMPLQGGLSEDGREILVACHHRRERIRFLQHRGDGDRHGFGLLVIMFGSLAENKL